MVSPCLTVPKYGQHGPSWRGVARVNRYLRGLYGDFMDHTKQNSLPHAPARPRSCLLPPACIMGVRGLGKGMRLEEETGWVQAVGGTATIAGKVFS